MKSAAVRLYGNAYSPPTRACLWLLRRFDIPFEYTNVNMFAGEEEDDDTKLFKQRHKAGTVPFLSDGSFQLSQGSSILKYLVEKFELPDHLYPRESLEKRAKIDQWLFWQHLNLRSACGALMHESVTKEISGSRSNSSSGAKRADWNRVITRTPSILNMTEPNSDGGVKGKLERPLENSQNRTPSFSDRKNVRKKQQATMSRRLEVRGGKLVDASASTVDDALIYLDTMLGENAFILGNELSLADVRIGMEINQIEAERHLKYARYGQMRYDLSEEPPLPNNIGRWISRLNELPFFAESHGMLDVHAKLFAAQQDFYRSRCEGLGDVDPSNSNTLQSAT